MIWYVNGLDWQHNIPEHSQSLTKEFLSKLEAGPYFRAKSMLTGESFKKNYQQLFDKQNLKGKWNQEVKWDVWIKMKIGKDRIAWKTSIGCLPSTSDWSPGLSVWWLWHSLHWRNHSKTVNNHIIPFFVQLSKWYENQW